MKHLNIIILAGIAILAGFLLGCSVDNKVEPAALQDLPAEIQNAIASGETIDAINRNGVARFPSSGTASCSNQVMLWYDGRLLYDSSCAIPPNIGYAENSAWNNSSEYKNLKITTSVGSVSYSVYKNGAWMEDSGGFAGGCAYGDTNGHYTRLRTYPDLTFRSYFPGASKIGLAYRLCNSVGYVWSPRGYGEDSSSGSPALRRETSVPDGVIGMQIALYIC